MVDDGRPTTGRASTEIETWLCTNTALRRASRKLGQLYDDLYAEVGLKATQVGVLIAISNGTASTMRSLADELDVQLSAITHALRPLVRDGLVDLTSDSGDGRSKRAELTTLGRAKLEMSMVLWENANSRVEKIMGQEAAADLRRLSEQVSAPNFAEAFLRPIV